MRPIKFRAWSPKEKCWCGAFSIHKSGLFSELINASIINGVAVSDAHWQELNNPKENPEGIVVMQFTGLLDKNGKEIYEGDVVKDENGESHEVIWDELIGVWAVKFYGEREPCLYLSHLQNSQYKCEVIGNVYENPELLTS